MFRRSITFSFAPAAYRALRRPQRMHLRRARMLARMHHARMRWARWVYRARSACSSAPVYRHDAYVWRVRRMYRQAKLL